MPSPMLHTAKSALRAARIDTLDAELLLARVLGHDRAWLLAHGETALTEEQKNKYDAFVERRKGHEPMAYILGEKEFYGRTFMVGRRVLIPRPATEALIDEMKFLFQTSQLLNLQTFPRITPADSDIVILTWINQRETINEKRSTRNEKPLTIIDIGTGSGCIAITLALEIPNVNIIATDISRDALEVAKVNAKHHGVIDRIEFVEADGMEGVSRLARHGRTRSRKVDHCLLVSNPPYIPEGSSLPPDVSLYEPHEALFAGADGMDVLTPLIHDAKNDPLCIGFSMEMRQEQAKKLMTIL